MSKIFNSKWILFGLSFDAASEIALLSISATIGAKGIPVIEILSLPIIFAAGMTGMSLMDYILVGLFILTGAISYSIWKVLNFKND
ncbi:HoxN/HupN/NixA family nickel/cobalt transporter [Clostridium sp.]